MTYTEDYPPGLERGICADGYVDKLDAQIDFAREFGSAGLPQLIARDLWRRGVLHKKITARSGEKNLPS